MDVIENVFKIAVLPILIILIIECFKYLDIDNKKNNENTKIIIYENSGEKIYENPEWYRFGNFGITFEKSGEHITTRNYKMVEITKGEEND